MYIQPKSRWRALALPAVALAFALSVSAALTGVPGSAAPKETGPSLSDAVPPQVSNGSATLVGKHPDSDSIQVLFYLPFKDWDGLKAFIADVSDPHSPNYGKYLTLDQENARFNPDVSHEQSVTAWLQTQGVTNAQVQTVANHLYVNVHTSAANIEKLLNIQINDYKLGNHTFFAPDRTPTLPAQVANDIVWIAGLSNYDQYQKFTNGIPNSMPPYTPQDIANAYNVNPLWNSGFTGNGTSIAITLWSVVPDDSTLNQWSSDTGAAPVTQGNGRLVVIPIDGGSTDPDDGEAALDIEATGGIAYQAQIRYYEAAQPSNASLANALNAAGTDAVFNRFISNSWGGPESTAGHSTIDPVLAANTATGHDYLFSSGDNGSWSHPGGVGQDPYPSYPTSSVFATSIGGTRFNGDINPNYPGEQSWLYAPGSPPEGSGGGYSLVAPRPAWQVAPGFPAGQTMRGYPDVSGDADPATGYYICSTYNGCIQIGGTSLSSPLWAGMLDIADQYAVAQGHPHLGFVNPALYALANAPQTYPPYHDITVGTNGAYTTNAGWDAVTGLGSTDLYNLSRDLAPPLVPTPTPTACQGFSDVQSGSTFYPYVTCLSGRGIINGYSDCTFRPGNNVTRGQLSKIISNSAGFNDTPSGQTFQDVAPGSTFYAFVERMASRGIIGGYQCGGPGEPCVPPNNRPYFRPNANATRGQISKIDVLAAQQALGWQVLNPPTNTFQDVAVGSTFFTFIETAYSHGVLGGYQCGSAGEPCLPPGNKPYFRPNNNATRGQTSKIVANTFFPNCQTPPTPTHVVATPTHSAGATNTPVRTVSPTRTVPTASPTRTRTPGPATATATPTCQGATNVIQNGGFDTGTFSPWTILGTNPSPVIRTSQVHGGTHAAFLGSDPGTEPLGDSSIYQQVTVPASGGTLSYWYRPYTEDSSIIFDWQGVYITDTSGTVLATVMEVLDNSQTWTPITYDMSAFAGQTVRVEFLVHQDGFGDVTNMYVDDVSLTAGCP